MKAIFIEKPGAANVLKLKDTQIPVPGEGQVLIRVRAAGVNRPDVLQRKGYYTAPAGASQDIPGLEVSGIVEACGSKVSKWKKGDKICALLAGGGYAEYALADEGNCLPIPEKLSFEEAAVLPETIFTVWSNVFQRGGLKTGEHFLIHGGTSGIGTTAIQLAKAFGATVYTTAGSQEKCEAALTLGADICINYKEADFEQVLKPYGVDVILDMIGGDYIAKNLRLLKNDGRMVFINASQGSAFQADAGDIMQRRLTITGSTLRGRDISFKAALALDIQEKVWPLVNNGKFTPVLYKTFDLKDAPLAHELMESSEHIGKIVLRVNS